MIGNRLVLCPLAIDFGELFNTFSNWENNAYLHKMSLLIIQSFLYQASFNEDGEKRIKVSFGNPFKKSKFILHWTEIIDSVEIYYRKRRC